MSAFALAIVLLAALLHASWNALVKSATDRAVTLAAVAAMHAVSGLVMLSLAPFPPPESWLYIAISTAIHYAYYILLFQAYRVGDLSLVYPIARGLAPAIVAASAYVLIGENLGTIGWAGLVAVSLGIGLLAWGRGASHASGNAIGIAIVLGLSIAAYSVADGIGVRSSPNPLSYIGWLFLLEFPVPLWIAVSRIRNRGAFGGRVFAIGLVGGLFSVVAYALVLYAKTMAPLGAVSAIRESSVIIASLIGLFLFGERPWKVRILAAIVVGAGVAALAYGA